MLPSCPTGARSVLGSFVVNLSGWLLSPVLTIPLVLSRPVGQISVEIDVEDAVDGKGLSGLKASRAGELEAAEQSARNAALRA